MERVNTLQYWMRKIIWKIGRQIRIGGWPVCMAFLWLALAAGLLVSRTRQESRLQELIAMKVNKPQSVEVVLDDLPEIKLAAFENGLPAHEAIPDNVKQLLLLAEKQELDLLTGEYKVQKDASGRYFRYQISLPVKGDYQEIQKFILKSLQEIRTLSVESLSFKRDSIESKEVEARLQLVLFTRAKPGNGNDEGEP